MGSLLYWVGRVGNALCLVEELTVFVWSVMAGVVVLLAYQTCFEHCRRWAGRCVLRVVVRGVWRVVVRSQVRACFPLRVTAPRRPPRALSGQRVEDDGCLLGLVLAVAGFAGRVRWRGRVHSDWLWGFWEVLGGRALLAAGWSATAGVSMAGLEGTEGVNRRGPTWSGAGEVLRRVDRVLYRFVVDSGVRMA